MAKIEFIPPGFDPTTQEYKPDGPTCSGCLTLIVAVCCALGLGGFIINAASSRVAAAPTQFPAAAISTATYTREPTSTGTVTPMPPTNTPAPTETLQPSITPSFIPPPTKGKPVITATDNGIGFGPVFTATSLEDGRKYTQSPTATPTRYRAVKRPKERPYVAPTETPGG